MKVQKRHIISGSRCIQTYEHGDKMVTEAAASEGPVTYDSALDKRRILSPDLRPESRFEV